MSINRLFIALSFLFIAGVSFGQERTDSKQWKELESADGVKIQYRKGACDQPKLASYTEEIYLKFSNTTDQTIFIRWSYDATYGTKCFNCNDENEEMIQTIKLLPNSSKEAECGDKNDLHLRIFSKFTNMENPEPLNDFHVRILNVRPQE